MDLVLERCCGQAPIAQFEGPGVVSIKCPNCGREFRFPVYRQQGYVFPVNEKELKKQAEEWNKGVITIGR